MSESLNILFENIDIYSPSDNFHERRNLWIKGDTIQACTSAPVKAEKATKRIDARSLAAMPGLFDMHVHLREPGQEYKETIQTGTDSAKNGGFTGVCCMPNTIPAIDNAPTVEYIINRGKTTLTEVHVCASITKGREGKELAPMLELKQHGAVMFSDDGACVMNAEVMNRAFKYLKPVDGLISQHCEEHTLTEGFAMHDGEVSAILGLKGYPSIAEEIIVARDIMLAAHNGNCRYHVSHLSTAGSIDLVRQAKLRGQRVTCEVTPHHFTLTDEAVRHYDTNAKMNPPLRTKQDIEAIITAVKDGTVDAIATDHAPHAVHEKELEFAQAANGITGLETSFGLSMTHLVHAGHIGMMRLVELMSTMPREILGLQQVSCVEGALANLTIADLHEEWTFSAAKSLSKSKNTPFGGFVLRGKPKFAINRGQIWECDL
ncbi:MAG: dihydroorotase [Candidatus Kapabacteria bacterium]|jgi:dihydroorotase|nr:dihydroorotase [Candidatus Kapabacteria bacterium]